MAKKSVKREQIEIDPMFFIPEGVDELVYTDGKTESEDSEADFGYYEEPLEATYDYSDTPGPPTINGIVSQQIRIAEDGYQVVDVTLDVDDVPGYSKYEIKVIAL